MSSGPQSDAILVNLLLGGRLDDLLSQPASHTEIAHRINTLIDEHAARLGQPTRTFTRWTISRWIEAGW